jgi:acetylornithine deacetylase
VRESAAIRHLREYIAIPSVNPMRRADQDPAIVGERRYAEHVREQLRRLGLDAELVGDPERPSVVAHAAVRDAGETLLVASHLDTVPVDGMEIPPFDPRVADGRVFGRGSCDTKGGMAALVAALERVLAQGTLRRNVIVVGEADEELGGTGVNDVIAHLAAHPPDWVIATEPTELRVVTRHKGIVHARLRASGVACHSSDPGQGRSAVLALCRAVLALDELASEIGRRPDPKLGPATLSVGQIGGGTATNIVPDDAWLLLDRRCLPGEDETLVRAQLEGLLAKHALDDVRIEWCSLEKAALATPDEDPSVRAVQAALRESALDPTPDSVAFGTDAGVFSAHGIPGVVFGPGSIAQAHTATEWVAIDQVEAASSIFERILTSRD